MTDLQKLKEVFLNQQERGIKSGDWTECECEEIREGRWVKLSIPSECVIFYFNQNERFVGMVNWKE